MPFSATNQNVKNGAIEMDTAPRTRDLGMSSLLEHDKSKADFVAVLHISSGEFLEEAS